jgi:hypothetical protein
MCRFHFIRCRFSFTDRLWGVLTRSYSQRRRGAAGSPTVQSYTIPGTQKFENVLLSRASKTRAAQITTGRRRTGCSHPDVHPGALHKACRALHELFRRPGSSCSRCPGRGPRACTDSYGRCSAVRSYCLYTCVALRGLRQKVFGWSGWLKSPPQRSR